MLCECEQTVLPGWHERTGNFVAAAQDDSVETWLKRVTFTA